MFKKPSEVKALQRLSGADRKKLRRTIRDRFTQASDADLDLILPPKVDISVARLTNRAYVYAVEGGPPMLFDLDGRGNDIFPTVYALWKAPSLLPSFLLKGGEVSRYVLGGADLMFPGIYIPPDGVPSFAAGEPWAVKVPGNAAPIAVGITNVSSAEAIKAGLRGKALRITHYYKDTLWESAEGRYVPNEGFFGDMVTKDPAYVPREFSEMLLDEDASSVDEDSNENGNSIGNKLETKDSVVDSSPAVVAKDNVREEGVSKEIEGLAPDLEAVKMDGVADAEAESAEAPMTIEEIDRLLDTCLLQALHTTVKEKDLPMPSSTLWSNHILSCRPPGTTLDLKKSSHKKLSKWLQFKSSTGLISAKEDKHRKEVMLLGFNRGHPDFLAFKPMKKVTPQEVHTAPSVSDGHQAGKLEVFEVWKCSSHVSPIFEAVGADPSRLYSSSEASDVVYSYVEKENLVKGNDKAIVVLDASLCDALYKGTIKKGNTYPTEIYKKDLGATLISRMQAHFKVVRGNESAVRKGALKTVQIMTERRQGNKKVTKVSGIESFLVDAEHLANELQKKFACSTSVAEVPGKKGQYEVLVQGGVIEDLGKHLISQYGIPKKYIEILDKTKR
ncbi:hypothetical protein GOP47_0027297 [Adiantum capillus-veneris]|nr:hypothetical protein GOP47_0027297 [Adiantum capillus-veneris]